METILSPLRFPGAKRRLYPIIDLFFQENRLRPDLFVEPFAGGASISLQLLGSNLVSQIALGDSDPLISSFWKTVFYDTEFLLKKIEEIEVTIKKWKQFKYSEHRTDRHRAIACLFLNRTSFSGILSPSAGPIGGWKQKSEYKIDCRFNRNALQDRIEKISNYRNQVAFIECGSWKKTISRAERYKRKNIFFYLDPPFFKKANYLYRYFFEKNDHDALRNYLRVFKGSWLLSYDHVESFRKLYDDPTFHCTDIQTLYSASTVNGRDASTEVLVTNVNVGRRLNGKKNNGFHHHSSRAI